MNMDESNLDVSIDNFQKLQLNSITSIILDDVTPHLSSCLLEKKICVISGKKLIIFDLHGNRVSQTILFEKYLRHVTCCETYQETEIEKGLAEEWIAVSNDDSQICLLNANTGEKSFLNVECEEWKNCVINTLQLSSSKNFPQFVRMLFSCESGEVFISKIFNPQKCTPQLEDFFKFDIKNDHFKLISFRVNFLNVDKGDVICVKMYKDGSHLCVLNCDEDCCQIVSESMFQGCFDGELKSNRIATFVADNEDCSRAVVVFDGVVYVWNVEMMSLELLWKSDEELLDVAMTRSDVVLFLKKGDINNVDNLSIELRSFPNMALKERIEAGETNTLVSLTSCSLLHGYSSSHYMMEDNVYYFVGDTELKLMSLEQADVASRILKLISKGNFSEAEKLAANFGVDISPALKTKISFCVNYVNNLLKIPVCEDKNELEDDIKYNQILSELFQCLKLTNLSCEDLDSLLNLVLPSLNHSTQLFNSIKSKLKEIESSPDHPQYKTASLRSRLNGMIHKLGTYVTVCCDFNMRDWKNFSRSPPRHLFMKFVKKGWLESAEVIWCRHRVEIVNLSAKNETRKTEMYKLLSSIPKQVLSASVVRFIKKVIIPEIINDLESVREIASWIHDEVKQLETLEPHLWPQNAISLCKVFDSWESDLNIDSLKNVDCCLNFAELAAKICYLSTPAKSDSSETNILVRINNLALTLLEINDLKIKYGCSFGLSTLENESTETIAFRMLDRIVAVEIVGQVVKDAIKPYLLSKNMNIDEVLLRYVEMRVSSDVAFTVEKMVQIIRSIENFASKCGATEHLIRFIPMPWSDRLSDLVDELLSTDHPLVTPIRNKYRSACLDMMLRGYGISHCIQDVKDAEQVVQRIIRAKGSMEDCLKVAEYGKLSVSDILYLKAETVCSDEEIGDVLDLLEGVDSYSRKFGGEETCEIQDVVADKLIELDELIGTSRFKYDNTKFHKTVNNILSHRSDKFNASFGNETYSFERNSDVYKSTKQRLSRIHCDEFDLAVEHDLSDCKSYYDSFVTEKLPNTCTSNDDMDLLPTIIEGMSKSLPTFSAVGIEAYFNKHRWVKIILKIYQHSSDFASKMSEDELEIANKMKFTLDSHATSFSWSDISHIVKDLLQQGDDWPLREFVALAKFLLTKQQHQLSLQIFNLSLEMLWKPRKSEFLLQSNMLGTSSFEFSIAETDKEESRELFATIFEHMKVPVLSIIEKFVSTFQYSDLIISLLLSCFSMDEAVKKLGDYYHMNAKKFKKQKFVATIALAYHHLKDSSQANAKFFATLSLNSDWAYKLAQCRIDFKPQWSDNIREMALCIPLDVSNIFRFVQDYNLSMSDACKTSLETLLSLPSFKSSAVHSRIIFFCTEYVKICKSSEDLISLLEKSLLDTDGRNYEKIGFVLSRMDEIDHHALNQQHADASKHLTTREKINFLNFLESYKPSEKVDDDKMDLISNRDDWQQKSSCRLSFHDFFKGDVWNIVKKELNQKTVNMWRSIAHVLKISEDSLIITAMIKILDDALGVAKKCGVEISDEAFELLMDLNRSIDNIADAVKVCDSMIDTLPENHLRQKMELYELCASLCEVWHESDGDERASNVRENCWYNRNLLLAMQIFIERGFHDLVEVLDKERSAGRVLGRQQVVELIERLYEHETVMEMWSRRKSFTLDDTNVHAAVEHLITHFELDKEAIHKNLLKRWLPSTLQAQMELENVSMIEDFENTDKNIGDDERRLVLAIHLLCHMEPDKACPLLEDIILNNNSERLSECRIRAIRCLLRISPLENVKIELSVGTTNELINFVANLIAISWLEKAGISENVEDFETSDKIDLVRKLGRKKQKSNESTVVAASFAASYGIFDIDVLGPTMRALMEREHFSTAKSLVSSLLRSSLKQISSNDKTLEWFQETVTTVLFKTLACDSSTIHLNLQVFEILLTFPGCLLMKDKNRKHLTSMGSDYSQLNMEPCSFAIALMSKDMAGMDLKSLMSAEYKQNVLSRLEEWVRQNIVTPLLDRIKSSLKIPGGNEMAFDITSPTSMNMSHWADLDVTSNGFFCNQESFIQECQSVLDMTALNGTSCQVSLKIN